MLSQLRKNKAVKILEILEENQFSAMIAGGAVRDQLLGLKPADYDIATTAKPEQVIKIFESIGAQVIPTGISHGTVTVLYHRSPYEITTTRKDAETDGRHAAVQFGESFEEDAKRRDFTVNALFEDKSGRILDYVEGRKDLRNGVLKFVGDAEQRVKEDYLRILRLYRFWGQLGLTPDSDARNAAASNRVKIADLSQERKTSELMKTLFRTKNPIVYEFMISDKILEYLIYSPEYTLDIWLLNNRKFIQQYESIFKDIFLLSQFYKDPNHFDSQIDNYCVSKAYSRAGKCFLSTEILLNPSNKTAHLMECLDRIELDLGEDNFFNAYLPIMRVQHSEDLQILDKLNLLSQCETKSFARRKEKLPINGNQLKDRFGLHDGPELGDLLFKLKTCFRNGKWDTPQEAFQLVSTWLTQSDTSSD